MTASSDLMRAASSNQSWFDATQYGPLTIKLTAAADFTAKMNACDSALIEAGVVIGFAVRFCVFDPALYGGGGVADPALKRADIRGGAGVVVHEWGHIVGLIHEDSVDLPEAVWHDRGDLGSIMGNGGDWSPAECAWLGYGLPVVVSSPGTFRLPPTKCGQTPALRLIASAPLAATVLPFTGWSMWVSNEYHS